MVVQEGRQESMKVWVLIYKTWDYSEILGIYAKEELAEAEKAKIKAIYPESIYEIEDYELRGAKDAPAV